MNVLGMPVFIGTQAMRDAAGGAPGAFWVDMSFTASQTQSFNAGFILIFAPVFAALWPSSASAGRIPTRWSSSAWAWRRWASASCSWSGAPPCTTPPSACR